MTARARSQSPASDPVLADIADYVADYAIESPRAYDTARNCLLDSLGCAVLALNYPACTRVLGPVVPGGELVRGVPVPGTSFELDPVAAAFNIGAMIRWLDYNDTWLAAEWGHPSDNLGAILACSDYVARNEDANASTASSTMGDVLTAMIKAYEIQGVLALDHAFNRVGLDHVLLVRIASTAVSTALLGGNRQQIINAVSNAWIDGGALRTYRHGPNTGSRKSWAAGDAASRGVRLALLARAGEMGYPTALSAKTWGFHDVLFDRRTIELGKPLGSYVIENVLFKVSFPAEFHAQTAVEAAIRLHPQVRERMDKIERVQIDTQEAAARIIDKAGPLRNPADRDHCLQYMVAIGLIHGSLDAEHYEDEAASDPRIDWLRSRMHVTVLPDYSRDYLDPKKRSIANAVEVSFNDGARTDRIEVSYPIGHPRRRNEAMPMLKEKYRANLESRFDVQQCQELMELFEDSGRLERMSVVEFMDRWRPGDEKA